MGEGVSIELGIRAESSLGRSLEASLSKSGSWEVVGC